VLYRGIVRMNPEVHPHRGAGGGGPYQTAAVRSFLCK